MSTVTKKGGVVLSILWVCAVSTPALAERVVLFPLEAANVDGGVARAVELTVGAELEARGYHVISGAARSPKNAGQGQPETVAQEPAAPAVTAGTDDKASAEGDVAASADVREAPVAEVDKTGDRAVAAPAAEASGISQTQTPVPGAADKARIAADVGARFYVDGVVVKLGPQMSLELRAFTADGRLLASKRSTVRGEVALPRAVQLSVEVLATEMSRHSPPPPAEPSEADAAGAAPASRGDDVVVSNFGVAVGQLISLTDTLHTFTFINFNGRFEFNRLLLITNAGFALGNKEVEDGFHFNLNLSLAGYLTRTQVSPYLGGGMGLFVGNRLTSCDENEYGDVICGDDAVVGWDVFPTLGVELLRTRPIRVHVESRYLITFNAYRTWGHGPMIVIGAAF